MGTTKYTDEEIMILLRRYKTIYDLRKENEWLYLLANRRGLTGHLMRHAKRNYGSIKERDRTLAKIMYKKRENKNECRRCYKEMAEAEKSRYNKTLCRKCFSTYIYRKRIGVDHNKWNVRDEFCHTEIAHHEKVFKIGIEVDQKTQDYLTLVGYGFIFKDREED